MKFNRLKLLFTFLFCISSLSFNLPFYAAGVEKPAGRIVSMSGTVSILKEGKSTNAKPFHSLEAGDVVTTGPNSRAAIILRDETLIKLNANSKITIQDVIKNIRPVSTGSSDKTLIKQDSGEMWIRTKNRPGKLEIDTKSGSAAIRGTEFTIDAKDDKTLLTLLDGAAELSNSHGTVLVAKNEQGEATPGSAPTKRTITVEETENAVQWIFYWPQNLKIKKESILDTSLENLTKNYEENPNESEPKILLGIKKLILGHSEESLELLNEAAKIDSNSALIDLMRSKALFVLHRQKEALEAINSSIALDPEWYLPRAEKSKLLIAQNDFIKAEKEAKKAIELSQDAPEAWISLGEVQYSLGNVKASEVSFNKALSIDSELAEAHIGKAKTLISRFYNPEAIDEFLSAVLIDPNYARAHLYLGQAFYQSNQTEKAITEITEARRLDPKDPLVLNSLSIIYDVAHEYAMALELDEKTIELTPNLLESGARQSRNLSVASGNLGIEPLRFGLTDWAFFQANKALRENPIDGASHFTLGTIYNSNNVQPIIPKSEGAGASQAQLSTGQVRGLRGTNLSGINARSSTNEFDKGYNFASDSERLVGKILSPSIIGSPNGRYRFFRAKELYVTTEGFIGRQQISRLKEGTVMLNGYLGTPWNLYVNGEFMGGLVRDDIGDLKGKGHRTFFRSDFAFSPLKNLDVLGSFSRADVNLDITDKNFPKAKSDFTPELNDLDLALNWRINPNNSLLGRYFGEVISTRLDGVTPELGGLKTFAGIFPRNQGGQFRFLSNHKKHKFTSGAEWLNSNNPAHVNASFLSTGLVPPVQTIGYLQEKNKYNIITAYTQDLFRINPRTDLVLGVRYDQIFQKTKDDSTTLTVTEGMTQSLVDIASKDITRFSINPQLGLNYNIGQNTVVRLAAQRKAFYNTFLPELAPQDVAGLPFSSQNDFFTRGTEGWEYATSLEHKLPWTNAFVRAKPFYRRMTVRNFDSLPARNEDQKINNWGFDISYNQLIYKQVGFFANYVYQHIRNKTDYKIFDDVTNTLALVNGKIPALQVPNRFRFGWTWHHPSGISLNYINTFIGEKFGDLSNSKGNKIDSYLLGDVNLTYESPRTKSYLATFGVNNIYGASFKQTTRQRDPGITFYGNIEIRGVLPISGHYWK